MGVVNPDIPYFSLLLLVAFLHEHNVYEKSMRNIDVRIHVKLGVEVLIKIFFRPNTNHLFPHPKMTHSKIYTSAKNLDSGRKFLPTQPR